MKLRVPVLSVAGDAPETFTRAPTVPCRVGEKAATAEAREAGTFTTIWPVIEKLSPIVGDDGIMVADVWASFITMVPVGVPGQYSS